MRRSSRVNDGEAAHLLAGVQVAPLVERDLRYLRKALRYRFHLAGVDELGVRVNPPSRFVVGGRIGGHRAAKLDRIADWIVQAEA